MAALKRVFLTVGEGVKPVTDTGTANLMDAVGDIMVADVRGLTNVTIMINQLVDNGTVTVNLEGTQDGTNWSTLATALTEASFPAGANTAVATAVNSSAGMPLSFKQVRARLSVYTGTGTYTMAVAGDQFDTYR